MVADFICSCLD